MKYVGGLLQEAGVPYTCLYLSTLTSLRSVEKEVICGPQSLWKMEISAEKVKILLSWVARALI